MGEQVTYRSDNIIKLLSLINEDSKESFLESYYTLKQFPMWHLMYIQINYNDLNPKLCDYIIVYGSGIAGFYDSDDEIATWVQKIVSKHLKKIGSILTQSIWGIEQKHDNIYTELKSRIQFVYIREKKQSELLIMRDLLHMAYFAVAFLHPSFIAITNNNKNSLEIASKILLTYAARLRKRLVSDNIITENNTIVKGKSLAKALKEYRMEIKAKLQPPCAICGEKHDKIPGKCKMFKSRFKQKIEEYLNKNQMNIYKPFTQDGLNEESFFKIVQEIDSKRVAFSNKKIVHETVIVKDLKAFSNELWRKITNHPIEKPNAIFRSAISNLILFAL